MVRRQLLVALAALGVAIGSAAQASAQATARPATPAAATAGFVAGHSDAGPILGLGGLGGADFAVGGRYELGIKPLPNLGNGVLGIQGAVDYYNVDYNFLSGDSFTYIPISVVANYHVTLKNRKFDPFLGLGLGYLYARYDCGALCGSASTGGVYLVDASACGTSCGRRWR